MGSCDCCLHEVGPTAKGNIAQQRRKVLTRSVWDVPAQWRSHPRRTSAAQRARHRAAAAQQRAPPLPRTCTITNAMMPYLMAHRTAQLHSSVQQHIPAPQHSRKDAACQLSPARAWDAGRRGYARDKGFTVQILALTRRWWPPSPGTLSVHRGPAHTHQQRNVTASMHSSHHRPCSKVHRCRSSGRTPCPLS